MRKEWKEQTANQYRAAKEITLYSFSWNVQRSNVPVFAASVPPGWSLWLAALHSFSPRPRGWLGGGKCLSPCTPNTGDWFASRISISVFSLKLTLLDGIKLPENIMQPLFYPSENLSKGSFLL